MQQINIPRTANILRQKGTMTRHVRNDCVLIPPPIQAEVSQRRALFTSQRIALLTEFSCGKLASRCGKKHKNSRFFRLSRLRGYFSKNFFKVSKILCSGFKSACAFCFIAARCAAYVARLCLAYRVFLRKTREAFFQYRNIFLIPQGVSARTTKIRAFYGKKHKNSRFFLLLSCAHCLLGAISRKVRTHFVSPKRFRGKCERTLLAWRDFEESADAFCFAEAFSGKVQTHIASLA